MPMLGLVSLALAKRHIRSFLCIRLLAGPRIHQVPCICSVESCTVTLFVHRNYFGGSRVPTAESHGNNILGQLSTVLFFVLD